MGLNPLDNPVEAMIAVLGVGRLPRRGGQAQRRPRARVLVAPHLVRLADPALEGVRASTSTRCWRRSRRSSRATRRRSCSTTTGNVCEGTGENVFVIKDGVIYTPPQTAGDPRRDQPQVDASRSPATSATSWSSATSPAPSWRSPTRCSSPARPPSSRPLREIDDIAIGDRPARSRARSRSVFDDALHGRAPQYARVAGPGAGTVADVTNDLGWRWLSRYPLRHHPARRHAGRGHVALGRREGARGARARLARRAPDRGRLPRLEPQGGGALRAARGRDASSTPRSPPSA